MVCIFDVFIDDLLVCIDIVEVVGSCVLLKCQGKEYVVCCLFYDECLVLFMVLFIKQFYYCFGCGVYGIVISFLMNYDCFEFFDVVDELVKCVGMDVLCNENLCSFQQQDDSCELYLVLDVVMKFFQKNLEGSEKVCVYFESRGVDEENCVCFQIGYVLNGYSGLCDVLGKDEWCMKLFDCVGLFLKNDRGYVYDKFCDWVMFLIFDCCGWVIVFGGCVFEKDDGFKYFNLFEIVLFYKGCELYGLWQVCQVNQKIEWLIVVEGYMDVVLLFQFGVIQVVVMLGIVIMLDYVELLFCNVLDVFFCFDGDVVGCCVGWKVLELVLLCMKDGCQVFFLFLFDGEDLDIIVCKEGVEVFNECFKQVMLLLQFFFDELICEINLGMLDGKVCLVEWVKLMLVQIFDGVFGDLMKQQLVQLIGLGGIVQVMCVLML